MATHPVPVLLVSTLTREGADVTLRGWSWARSTSSTSPSVDRMELLSLSDDLRARVRALAGTRVRRRAAPDAPDAPVARTGGQRGSAEVGGDRHLDRRPAGALGARPTAAGSLRSAILVVQHMPAGFTKPLAERLAARSPLAGARGGGRRAGRAGPGPDRPRRLHMRLLKRGGRPRVALDEERGRRCTARRRLLMASVARHYGPARAGLILTGMGADGVLAFARSGPPAARTLAESEDSCVATACRGRDRRRRDRPRAVARADRRRDRGRATEAPRTRSHSVGRARILTS